MGTKKFDEELYKKADPLSNGIMELILLVRKMVLFLILKQK